MFLPSIELHDAINKNGRWTRTLIYFLTPTKLCFSTNKSEEGALFDKNKDVADRKSSPGLYGVLTVWRKPY